MMIAILAIGIYFFAFGIAVRVTSSGYLANLIFKVIPALCGLFLILFAIFNMLGVTLPA